MKYHIDTQLPGAYGLLIRHGERDEVKPGSIGMEAALTERGREMSRELGQSLAQVPLNKIITSPIDRCFDTGLCLYEGLGLSAKEAENKVVRNMAVAAAFVSDPEMARKTFSSGSPEQVILNQLSGKEIPGLRSLAEGSRHLLDFMTGHMAAKSLTIFVSHDAIIMPFQSHFSAKPFSSSNWLDFLEGSMVYADNGNIVIDGHPVKKEHAP
ncbi:MAG: histidine phosphatase family protein [Proteobacteria bacterium]|nr:histidine phosphatase family protein [Pseudomonadota bacterium]